MIPSLARTSVAALLLVTCRLTAQAPADFSGTWTAAPPARAAGIAMGSAPPTPSAPGDMGSGWGSEIAIMQDPTVLAVTYSDYHPRDIQPPLTFRYRLDGSASTNTPNVGRGPQAQTSTAAWEGAALVITTTHRFFNPRDGSTMTSETRQVLSLESPEVLVVETTRRAVLGGRPSTTRTVYKKK
jgi:hypothetical protein